MSEMDVFFVSHLLKLVTRQPEGVHGLGKQKYRFCRVMDAVGSVFVLWVFFGCFFLLQRRERFDALQCNVIRRELGRKFWITCFR